MGLVAAAIYIKLVEVPDEGVVRSRLGSVLRIQIDPLILNRLELGEVVEVYTAFARVATEEKYAVLEGETVSPRARSWLVVLPLSV